MVSKGLSQQFLIVYSILLTVTAHGTHTLCLTLSNYGFGRLTEDAYTSEEAGACQRFIAV